MFTRILIAVDDSEQAARAVEVGDHLAAALDARVALVHVIDPALAVVPDGGGIAADEILTSLRQAGEALLNTLRSRLAASTRSELVLREGRPSTEVVAAATEWGADLVVIGTHGRKGLERLVLGSTTDSVIRHASCPVVTVGPGAEIAAEGVSGRGADSSPV